MKANRPAVPLLIAIALLVPCGTGAEPVGPVEAALKFLEASLQSHCREVWPLYSAGTQENLRAEAHRRERDRAGLPQPETPEDGYCGTMGTLKRGTARIVRQQGDEAVVAAEVTVKVPGSRYEFFPSYKVVTEELRLVREKGEWRVERPRVNVGRGPDTQLVEVGAVDVFYPVRAFAGLLTRLEATAVVRASRDALEPALRDPKTWARVLPGVTAVDALERTGDLDRVRLSFGQPDRSVTVETRLYGKESDRPLGETALQWNPEGDNKAPLYFRGSWKLQPHEDGSTRVTLLFFIDLGQWPGDVTAGVFSPERMAQAVLGLGS